MKQLMELKMTAAGKEASSSNSQGPVLDDCHGHINVRHRVVGLLPKLSKLLAYEMQWRRHSGCQVLIHLFTKPCVSTAQPGSCDKKFFQLLTAGLCPYLPVSGIKMLWASACS